MAHSIEPVHPKLKYDKRMEAFFLRRKVISKSEVDEHVGAVPDVESKSVKMTVNQENDLFLNIMLICIDMLFDFYQY